MKLKSFLLLTVLGTVLTSATFANTPLSAKAKNVLDVFAESHVNTDAKSLEKILGLDALIKFTRGNEVLSQGQSAVIKLMRQNQGIKQNCSTEFDVLASSDALVLAKVIFYTRTLSLKTISHWN